MTVDQQAQVEQAFVLAETALGAAGQALETARVAESAAIEARLLAHVALDAARAAYEHADGARGSD
jgi:hypothetical protein